MIAATHRHAALHRPTLTRHQASQWVSVPKSIARRGNVGCSSTSLQKRVSQNAAITSRAPRNLVRPRAAATEGSPMQSSQMLVIVPPHPLVKHHLAVARNKDTPSGAFRASIAELGKILIYELSRDWLPTVDFQIESPCGVAEATIVDISKPVKLVPILRAGLVPLEQVAQVLPAYETYHVGYVRDDQTLQASMYLNKLPEKFDPEDLIIVSDPMLATGGTMAMCLNDLIARGAEKTNIRIVCVVACPPALTVLSEGFPGIRVYAAMIDGELNEKGYIVPGLGDAGDRAFGTA